MSKKSTIGQDQLNGAIEKEILKIASGLRVPENLSPQEIWSSLEKRIIARSETKIIDSHFNTFLRVAASLLLFVLAGVGVYQSQEVSVKTAGAEHKTLTLPDHSTVTLNAGSTLSFNKLTWGLNRKVFFTGEGLFSVAKGDKFEVISPNGITQVLGTEFNLISRGPIYRVACLEGKVRVSSINTSSRVILTPGLQTELEQNQLSVARPYHENITSWKTGEFYFENASLAEVFSTLELQYNITILSENNNRTYTGYFTNRNLEEALKLVCLPLQLHYEFMNSTIIKISP